MVTLNVIGTILSMLVFFGIIWWAFSKKRKQANEDAANLPFDLPDEGSEASGPGPQATDQFKSRGQS